MGWLVTYSMVPNFFGVTNVNATHFIGSNMTELLNIPTSITHNWGNKSEVIYWSFRSSYSSYRYYKDPCKLNFYCIQIYFEILFTRVKGIILMLKPYKCLNTTKVVTRPCKHIFPQLCVMLVGIFNNSVIFDPIKCVVFTFVTPKNSGTIEYVTNHPINIFKTFG